MEKIEEIIARIRKYPKGMAKAYQVKQVLKAIERLERKENVDE